MDPGKKMEMKSNIMGLYKRGCTRFYSFIERVKMQHALMLAKVDEVDVLIIYWDKILGKSSTRFQKRETIKLTISSNS